MILIFKLILITVFIVLALKVAMSEDMLLEKLGRYFEEKLDRGHKWVDLFICPWCAVSLQSITAHGFAFGLGLLPWEWDWQLLIRLPLVIFGASFISGMLWTLYLTINQMRERNEEEFYYYKNLNDGNKKSIS